MQVTFHLKIPKLAENISKSHKWVRPTFCHTLYVLHGKNSSIQNNTWRSSNYYDCKLTYNSK